MRYLSNIFLRVDIELSPIKTLLKSGNSVHTVELHHQIKAGNELSQVEADVVTVSQNCLRSSCCNKKKFELLQKKLLQKKSCCKN